MIVSIFQYLIISFFLIFFLCLERVMGLPLGFLALLGFWFAGSDEDKQKKFFLGQKNFYLKKMAGLVFATLVLAVVYNLHFFLSAIIICISYYSYFLVKRVIVSDRWRWLIAGLIGVFFVGLYADYSFNILIFFQLIFSSLVYWIIRILIKK